MANQCENEVYMLDFEKDDTPLLKCRVINSFKTYNEENPENCHYDNNDVFIDRLIHHDAHNEFIRNNDFTL